MGQSCYRFPPFFFRASGGYDCRLEVFGGRHLKARLERAGSAGSPCLSLHKLIDLVLLCSCVLGKGGGLPGNPVKKLSVDNSPTERAAAGPTGRCPSLRGTPQLKEL